MFADALHLFLVGSTTRILRPRPIAKPPPSASGTTTTTTLIRAFPNDDEDPVQKTELWLDLRGTKLLPRTALERLEFDLEYENLVNRVLMTSENRGDGKEDCARDVVMVHQDTDEMVFAESRVLTTMSTTVTGRRVQLKDPEADGGLTDPLPALDAVTEGRWCLLDSQSISDHENRSGAVASLVELLFGAGSGGGLLLGDSTPIFTADNGGIAWTGFDKRDIFHAAALLQTLRGQSNIVTTDSGILLTGSAPSPEPGVTDKGETFQSKPQTALVLPFDEILWKAAAMVFRMSTVDEYDGEFFGTF